MESRISTVWDKEISGEFQNGKDQLPVAGSQLPEKDPHLLTAADVGHRELRDNVTHRMLRDQDAGFGAVAWGGLDGDFDVLAEHEEVAHQAFDGESRESAAKERGDFWLIDREEFGR